MLSGESTPDSFTDFFGSLPNFELSPFTITSTCLSPNSNWIANKLASPTSSTTMEKIVMKPSPITHLVNSSAQLSRSDILGLAGLGQYWDRGDAGDLETPPIVLGHLEPGNELNFCDVDHFLDPSIEDSINLDAFIQNDDVCQEDLIGSTDSSSYLDVKTDTNEYIDQSYDQFEPEANEDALFVAPILPTVVQEEEISNVEFADYCEQEQESVVGDVQDILTISSEDLSSLSQFYYITPLEVDAQNNLTSASSGVSTEYIDIQDVNGKVVDIRQIKSEEQRSQTIQQSVVDPKKGRRESFKAPPPSSIKASAAARPVSNVSTAARPASTEKRPRRLSSAVTKDSDDYRDKRDRNNASVRKSRDKARQKQEETETRLEILSTENSRLQGKVDSLEKELAILRGLFKDAGSIPFNG